MEERKPNFRSANSVQRKTYDIETRFNPETGQAPTRGGELDLRVRQEFADDEAVGRQRRISLHSPAYPSRIVLKQARASITVVSINAWANCWWPSACWWAQ